MDDWAEAHAIFDPCEEGYCRICGMLADLDSGTCEDCHEALSEDMDEFDLAQGAYWAWADCHGGQASPEYEALSQSPYKPGACENGPEPGSDAEVYYARLLRARGCEPVASGETHPDEGLSRRC